MKGWIVGITIGVLANMVYACVTTLAQNASSAWEGLEMFLSADIPLWYVLLMATISCGIAYWMTKRRKLPFLQCTERQYKGVIFQWVWKKDDQTGKYRMEDFWPLCPQCGQQLRIGFFDRSYHCTNNHHYPTENISEIRKDLVHELQREFMAYNEYLDLNS